MTDTDSLMYKVKTEDFYNDIRDDVREKFDTLDFEKDHHSGIPTGINKKVAGMMKDGCGGKIILEFVGLRLKLSRLSRRIQDDGWRGGRKALQGKLS